jgi:cell division protein FtsB
VDYTVKNARLNRSPADAPRESFGEQLRSFFRRNALWFLLVALAWLLVQDIFGTHGVLAMHRSRIELQKVQTEINQLDDENVKLQGQVKDLQSDPTTIERIARSMGLGRPYDLVFKTHPRPAASTPTDPSKKNP